MKRVLIATTNNDKFDVVKRMFEATIFPKDEFKIDSLKTLNIQLIDEEEIGDNSDRARQKAISASKQLKDYDFDYIVGLDDAIFLKGELRPNVKDYLTKLLYENYLAEGEEYAFNRAYCFVDKEGNEQLITATIPYIYRSTDNAVIKECSYPLSKVAIPLGYDKPIDELSSEEELNYYLKYVKEALEKINID